MISTTAIYETEMFGGIHRIRANFTEASCPVEVEGHDGWQPMHNGKQVADFSHSPQAAMREVLEYEIMVSGDDVEEWRDRIEAAVEAME